MKIYLAGPIMNCDDSAAHDWRDLVTNTLKHHECINPMRRDYRGIEDLHASDIVMGDKLDILQCDYILAMCAIPSVGTSMEILFAWENHKKIYCVSNGKKLSPWIQYHSDMIFESLGDALVFLSK